MNEELIKLHLRKLKFDIEMIVPIMFICTGVIIIYSSEFIEGVLFGGSIGILGAILAYLNIKSIEKINVQIKEMEE